MVESNVRGGRCSDRSGFGFLYSLPCVSIDLHTESFGFRRRIDDGGEVKKYVEVRFGMDLKDIDADRLDGEVIRAEKAFYKFEHRLEELRKVVKRHREE